MRKNLSQVALAKCAFEKEAGPLKVLRGLYRGAKAYSGNASAREGIKKMFGGAADTVTAKGRGGAKALGSLSRGTFNAAAPAVKNYGQVIGPLFKSQFQNLGSGAARNLSGVGKSVEKAIDPAKLTPWRRRLYEQSRNLQAGSKLNQRKWDRYTNSSGFFGKKMKQVAGMPATWNFAAPMVGFGAANKAFESGANAVNQYKADKIMDAHNQFKDMPLLHRLGFAASPDSGIPKLLEQINPNQYARLLQSGRIQPQHIESLVNSGQLDPNQLQSIIDQLS